MMATTATSGQTASAAADNAGERDRTKCTGLDPGAFPPVECPTITAFRARTTRWLSCNQPPSRRVIFAGSDTESPGWFSFHWPWLRRLVCVRALVGYPAMRPDRMERSIGPNSARIALSMTPINRNRWGKKRGKWTRLEKKPGK